LPEPVLSNRTSSNEGNVPLWRLWYMHMGSWPFEMWVVWQRRRISPLMWINLNINPNGHMCQVATLLSSVSLDNIWSHIVSQCPWSDENLLTFQRLNGWMGRFQRRQKKV
jgi:hypothetical protein